MLILLFLNMTMLYINMYIYIIFYHIYLFVGTIIYILMNVCYLDCLQCINVYWINQKIHSDFSIRWYRKK